MPQARGLAGVVTAGTGRSSVRGPLFMLTGIRKTSDVELSWSATAGKHYRIYAVSRLDAPFTPIREVAAATTGLLTQDMPADSPTLFFIMEELQ